MQIYCSTKYIEMIVETCFQRLYRVIGLIANMILSTTCDSYLLLFTSKSKQISESSQKRDFNGYTGVTMYADFEYIYVNIR